MGYRSDIKLITTKEGWEELDKAVSEAEPEQKYRITSLATVSTKKCAANNKEYVLVEWIQIKWYLTSPQIRAFMQALYTLANKNIMFKFIRVGEDYEDIERIDNEDEPAKGTDYLSTDYCNSPSLYVDRIIVVDDTF